MRPTDRFRRQHRELQTLAAELIKLSLRPRAPGRELQRATARFAGKLKIHAAMETEALYPLLLEHEDPEIRARATELHGELGPLYGELDEFEKRWSTAEAIEERRFRYRLELARILQVLGRRMIRENRLLYPMADQHL